MLHRGSLDLFTKEVDAFADPPMLHRRRKKIMERGTDFLPYLCEYFSLKFFSTFFTDLP